MSMALLLKFQYGEEKEEEDGVVASHVAF